MKGWIAALAAGGIALGSGTAQAAETAADTRVDKITCTEIVAMNPEDQNRIAYWVQGYADAENESSYRRVAFDKSGQAIGELVEECKVTLHETLWQKVKKYL